MKKVVHAACPHDCPDACGVLITVEDGRATRIQGDPSHPVTRGFLCAKVAKYLDRVYSPERVLYPMRRIAPKGNERSRAGHVWKRGWLSNASPGDEALDEIANRFQAHSPPNSAARRSCRTPTAAPGECSTALPWTAVSFIAWARRNWRATSARRRAKPDSSP